MGQTYVFWPTGHKKLCECDECQGLYQLEAAIRQFLFQDNMDYQTYTNMQSMIYWAYKDGKIVMTSFLARRLFDF